MPYKTDINYRLQSLRKLAAELHKREDSILKALHDDFRKPEFEGMLTETSYVFSDLENTIKNLAKWAKPKKVVPSLLNFPSQDYIYSEPYGKILLIAPWNYPFQLALSPLIAAVAAGNQLVVKPSELTPKTAQIVAEVVAAVFDKNHVDVVQGDAAITQKLLAQRWDYIFFTGSVAVGKIVAQAAALHLTPITLELGGKNPCIVDTTADLRLAAKRIVWGKFINAGQTCIAPDYLLVHAQVKTEFTNYLREEIQLAYGENPELSPDYCRIINQKNWNRLNEMMRDTTLIYGGETNEKELYIAPTLIDQPSLGSLLMQEEIFGPLLPIISYQENDELCTIIKNYEKPLSLYVFSTNASFYKKIIQDFSFGGGAINDTVIHFINKRLPFGGVGNSGTGAYHGKFGFNTFSHQKSVVKKANWLDLTLRYAPYQGKLRMVKQLLRWL